jgi:integrase/recombinase XerD
MSALAPRGVDSDVLIRDLRHMSARAAPDLADWLVHLELEGKADRTLYAYTRAVAPLLRAHPDTPVEGFTHTDINDQLRLVPQRSRHINRSIYNQFFEWAEMDERVERSPMNRVPKMRHPKRRPKDIFSEEEIALLESLSSPDGQLWTLLFGSGLRRGEARQLCWQHVDLSRARLIVYAGKGDKDRIVPLATAVLTALADLALLEDLRAEDYLWYSRPGGGRRKSRRTPIGDTTFEHWYKRGIAAAGVRYLNPHQTRHTFGHRLRELGFDLEERALLMGHEDSRTTQKYYGHLTIEDVARKVAAL